MITVPKTYSEEYIETTKCRPFIDKFHEKLIEDVGITNYFPIDDTFQVAQFNKTTDIFEKFKKLFTEHITGTTLNSVVGLENSKRNDIILGCTQYIDDLHIRFNELQVLEREYNYHKRLRPNIKQTVVEELKHNIPLIISLPFSYYGGTHPMMNEILDVCTERNIPVHLDCAWLTACKNVHVNFNHPAVVSVGFSLSKGYGLSGWNRIGVRYTKDTSEDSITMMNDNLQIPSLPVIVGTHFMSKTDPDHLWKMHGDNHHKICADFNLESTDTIHMAKKENKILGIAPLLRYLENV